MKDWTKHKLICKSIISSRAQGVLGLELSSTGSASTILSIQQLFMDCKRGYLPGIQKYISSGANINIKIGNNEETPLLLACICGHDKCVELLLQHGADFNIFSTFQVAPLYVVSKEGNDKCLSLLLKNDLMIF